MRGTRSRRPMSYGRRAIVRYRILRIRHIDIQRPIVNVNFEFFSSNGYPTLLYAPASSLSCRLRVFGTVRRFEFEERTWIDEKETNANDSVCYFSNRVVDILFIKCLSTMRNYGKHQDISKLHSSFSPFCFSCSLSPSISVCSELFFTSLVDTKKKTLTNVEAVKTPCVTIWLKTLSTPLPIVNNVLGSCLSFSDPSSHPMCPFFRFSFNLWQAKLTGRNT